MAHSLRRLELESVHLETLGAAVLVLMLQVLLVLLVLVVVVEEHGYLYRPS